MKRRGAAATKSPKKKSAKHEEADHEPIFAEGDDAAPPHSGEADPFAEFREVAKNFTAFRPAAEVFKEVRAVPTIFPDYDRATMVGGHPIERITLVHGPSASGKSIWNIGLILSHLILNHPAALIDGERSSPRSLLRMLMGKYLDHPFFFGSLPDTYEQTKNDTTLFCNQVRDLREKGKLHADVTALLVVDSIRKLVPKDQYEQFLVLQQKVLSGDAQMDDRDVSMRMGQMKARMHAVWLDDLVPLLEKTGTSMVIVTREMEDPDAPAPRAGAFGKKKKAVKREGGRALFYDASLDLEFELAKTIGKGGEDGKGYVRYGERYDVTITKSKVSGKTDTWRNTASFHLSNGVFVPEGFDRARDVLDVARRYDVVEGTSWLKYNNAATGSMKFQGEEAFVKAMQTKPELLAQIENEARSFFKKVA